MGSRRHERQPPAGTHLTKPGRVTVPHPKKDIPRGPVASIYRKVGWIMQKEETMRFVFFIHRDDVGYGVCFRNSRAACP